MSSPKFHYEEFELFYLAELTRKKIKPLSRWEKPLDKSLHRWLQRQDLMVDVIPRKTLLGKEIFETIFSSSSRYLDFYRKKFSNSFLNKSPQTQRTEGFLFGYPSCCVEQFISEPYIRNGLAKQNQRLLFHWACPDCPVTREFLSYYQPIHKNVWEWYKTEFSPYLRTPRSIPKKMAIAAAIALWLSAVPLAGQIIPDTTHFIPVPGDDDGDGLSYAEEVYVGSDFTNMYSYTGINDNDKWTQYFKTVIDSLPTTPQQNTPYKLEFYAFGIEVCQNCGTTVNMGYVKLVNPLRNLEQDIPFIGLHFLENGCFSYNGNLHTGRIDIDTLKQILFPFDPAHVLNVVGDNDNDGLTDSEEDSLYLDPNNPDSDGDGVPDGPQVTEQLIRLFPKLKEQSDSIHSNIILNWTFGLENCTICGSQHNMGNIEFQNPENGNTFQIHFNGLHALAHGSFAYNGTTWSNQRANAVALYRTMKTHMLHIPNDADNDGLTDDEEPDFGYNSSLPDTDGDGICDGKELSFELMGIYDNLPTSPVSNSPYVIHYPTFGSWNCLLCGEPINMGYMELYNPNLGNTPLLITYYAYHFLKKGSFAFEGRIDYGQWIEGRVDPVQLANYLGYPVTTSSPQPSGISKTILLKQNYPNPFNPETVIQYVLPKSSVVTLEIYNMLGQKVCTLFDGIQDAGEHKVVWKGLDETEQPVPSAVYIYRLAVEGNLFFRKMFLIK